MTRPSILMTTEGTYPYQKGGVSTWCHELTQEIPEVDYQILAVVANPYLPQQYQLSSNVQKVIKLPLWGIDDPVEYSWQNKFSKALKSKINTTQFSIKSKFIPIFSKFIYGVLGGDLSIISLGELLLGLHDYFLAYDYHITMRSSLVWETFKNEAVKNWQKIVSGEEITIAEISEALQLFYRFFLVINYPIPQVDLTHSSAAAFCGLPCVLAKLKYNIPFLLTEHGINIREQYLNLSRSINSRWVKLFLHRLMGTVVKLNYHYADQISPVCAYNARWEKWWGVPPNKIKVIYNGADPEKFHPTPRGENERPQVMNMGLIFPLKGQIDLIEAAAIVRDKIPNVEFRLYGKPSDMNYFARCQEKVKEYQLEETINFAGFTSEPWRAYSEADVVAMASISEGFPYAVIEAMLSGATLVSTDVGGVAEALDDTGLLVQANRPRDLAEAILKLLTLPADDRRKYGEKARDRALFLFTQKQCMQGHLDTYLALIRQAKISALKDAHQPRINSKSRNNKSLSPSKKSKINKI